MKRAFAVLALLLFAGTSASAADNVTWTEWKVDGVAREALAGKNDPLVRFAWQEWTIDAVRWINGCDEGKPWGEHCTIYPSKGGTPVVTYVHAGGHELPADVPPVIVKFFKENPKP